MGMKSPAVPIGGIVLAWGFYVCFSLMRPSAPVDRHDEPATHQPRQVVVLHLVEHSELDVGERADREGDSTVRESIHQRVVFDGSHAVVDPRDVK